MVSTVSAWLDSLSTAVHAVHSTGMTFMPFDHVTDHFLLQV